MTWTISSLEQALAVANNQLSLTTNTLPGTPLSDFLIAYCNNEPLTITNTSVKTAESSIVVTGNAAFLGVASLATAAIFTIDSSGNLSFIIRFALIGQTPGPSAWKFSTSFPNLPPFADLSSPPLTTSLLD